MLTPAGIFDTDSIEAMRIGAVKGLGIASIPRILIEEDLHSGRLVEIVPHAPLAPVALHMSHCFGRFPPRQIGRAHVCTPVTNAHLVCRLLLEQKQKQKTKTIHMLHSLTTT